MALASLKDREIFIIFTSIEVGDYVKYTVRSYPNSDSANPVLYPYGLMPSD